MGNDQSDLEKTIAEFGWVVRHVSAGEQPGEASISYTVGLTASGGPEFVVQPMAFPQARRLLNRLAEAARAGRRFKP